MIPNDVYDPERFPSLEALYLLGPRSPRGWLGEALGAIATPEFTIDETPSRTLAMEQLREQSFDIFLVDSDAQPEGLPELIQSVRCQTDPFQPVVVLADGTDRRPAAACLEAGAAAFVSMKFTTTGELAWQLQQAAHRGHEARELHRRRAWQQRHDEKQRTHVLRLADEQVEVFQLAAKLRRHQFSGASTEREDLAELTRQCRDFLRTYIVMGRGHLSAEIQLFADTLQARHLPLVKLLHGFSLALQQLIHDRGARSARHIFDRGNLLLLDLILKLADASTHRNAHEAVDYHSDLQRT